VPVRKFNAGGRVTCAIGAVGITTAWSFAGIVYAEGGLSEYFQSYDPTAGSKFAVGREEGKLTLYRESPSYAVGEMPSKEWLFIGVSKASGTAKPKMYIYRFSTKTWTITTGTVELPNASAGATAVAFGQWNATEQLKGKMAAAAIYAKALTEAEMKALVEVSKLEDWLPTGPKGLWFFNQKSTSEKVLDLTGNGADQTSTANTEVIEEEPPIPYSGEKEEESGGGMDIFDGAAIVEAAESILVEGKLVTPERSILVEGKLVPI
jgi:hypothetical protein